MVQPGKLDKRGEKPYFIKWKKRNSNAYFSLNKKRKFQKDEVLAIRKNIDTVKLLSKRRRKKGLRNFWGESKREGGTRRTTAGPDGGSRGLGLHYYERKKKKKGRCQVHVAKRKSA